MTLENLDYGEAGAGTRLLAMMPEAGADVRSFAAPSIVKALGVGVLICFHVSVSLGAKGDHIADRFKRFFSEPPVIKNLVLYDIAPEAGVTNVYELRWQKNATMTRYYDSLGAYKAKKRGTFDYTGKIAGSYKNYYWEITENTFYEWRPNEPYQLDDEKPGQAIQGALDFYLSRWLNLGIQHLSPGGIEWNGNQLQVTNKRGVVTKGTLVSTNGHPYMLKGVRYGGYQEKKVDFAHTFEGFGKNTPEFVPGTVNSLHLYADPQQKPTRVMKVKKLETSPNLLSREHFMPAEFFHGQLATHIEIREDGTYAEQPFGEYKQKRRILLSAFVALVLIIGVPLLVLYVRRTRRA